MQGNNFYFNTDPLLQPTSYDTQVKEIEKMEQAIAQRKQMLMQYKEKAQQPEQPVSRTPIWDEIDTIVSNLSEKEYQIVTTNEEFVESHNAVFNILQNHYLQMMRPIVEGSAEGKDALERHLTLVKRLRKSASKEVDDEISDFQAYKEKYSDMPYAEYQKMKREKSKKK